MKSPTTIGTPEYYRQLYEHSSPIPKISNIIWNAIMFAVWALIVPNILIDTLGVAAFFIPIVFIRRLWRPLFRNYVHPKVSKGLYKSDRRYKSVARQIGSYKATEKSIRVPLNKSEIKLYRVEGFLKLGITLLSYSLMYHTSQTDNFRLTQMSTKEKINIIQPGDTLYKNKKFIYYYSLINDNSKKYQEIAYDTIGTYVIFLALDSIQTNTDNRSEMQKVKGSPEYQEFKPEFNLMFKVDPVIKPIPNENEDVYKKKRIGKSWYLKPNELNVGKKNIETLK